MANSHAHQYFHGFFWTFSPFFEFCIHPLPTIQSATLDHLLEQLAFTTQEYSAGRMSKRIVMKKAKEIKQAMGQLSQGIPSDD